MALIDYANPTRFLGFAERVLPWLIGLTVLAFAAGLYLVQGAPNDYQQGATVEDMFLREPSAGLSMFGLGRMSVAALGTLVLRQPRAQHPPKPGAPLRARLQSPRPVHR